MTHRRDSREGFSLLELLAVVTILGIIAALIVPRLQIGADRTKEGTCLHNRTEINISVERYYLNQGAWPANDLSDIGTNADYYPEGVPACPVSGEAYRLDPTTHRVIGHSGSGNHSP